MKDCPFFAISLEVCYLIEAPFPVAYFKDEEKTGFALAIMITNSRGNRCYNVKLRMYMSDWQFCMMIQGVHYQVEIPFPVFSFFKCETGNGISTW